MSTGITMKVKVKVKFTLEHAMKVQMGSRGIALLKNIDARIQVFGFLILFLVSSSSILAFRFPFCS
jgi:uncharacterized lipoprotein YajG